jgi:uncharacterized membrane protein
MADEPPPEPTSQPIAPELAPIVSGTPTLVIPIPAAALTYPPAPGTAIAVQAQQTIWQGPYPPPEAIERYETVLPGSFDRILKMVEKLQDAQIEQNKNALLFTRNDTRRAHWLGFSLGAIACGGAVACLVFGYPWVAAAFLSVPVLGVANALIESVKTPGTPTPPSASAVAPKPLPTKPATPPTASTTPRSVMSGATE